MRRIDAASPDDGDQAGSTDVFLLNDGPVCCGARHAQRRIIPHCGAAP